MAKKSPTGSLPPAVPLAITPTFRPWTHTSDDSYIYQLSLVVAKATVSSEVVDCARARYDGYVSFGFWGVPVIARLFRCVSPHYEFVWHVAVRCHSDAHSDAYSG